MATVTELKRQKKNESRINIYLDGEYFVSADEVAVHKAGLKKGNEVDAQMLSQMLLADDMQRSFDLSLKFLSYRLRSKKEINVYLSEKGFDKNTIDDTIEKLLSYGYLNDLAFAQMYVRSQKCRYGIRKIEHNLKEFGISDEILQELDLSDDKEELLKLAKKYRNSHKNSDDKKLASYLLSKGFEWDSVKQILRDEDYE